MSPTPTTPVPLPPGLVSPIGTPEGDVSTSKILDAVTNAGGNTNLDALLGFEPRTLFAIDYIPSGGLVVTANLWAVATVVLVSLAVLAVVAALVTRRSGDTSRAAWIAEQEKEGEARRARAKAEQEALRRVQAGVAEAEAGEPR